MKIYFIESKEKTGLVKIGYTNAKSEENDPTYTRIKQYAEGLSDNAIVHDTVGTYSFEQYLHLLASAYRKKTVICLPKNASRDQEITLNPKEWFEFPANKFDLIREAIYQTKPRSFDEISDDDLPLFLLGMFSAIEWNGDYVSRTLQEKIESADSSDGQGQIERNNMPEFLANLSTRNTALEQSNRQLQNHLSQLEQSDGSDALGDTQPTPASTAYTLFEAQRKSNNEQHEKLVIILFLMILLIIVLIVLIIMY